MEAYFCRIQGKEQIGKTQSWKLKRFFNEHDQQ